MTLWFTGNFIEARSHLEQALAIFDPVRDRDLAFRFGQDVGVSAMVYLAIVLWPLGEVDRARELAGATATQIAKLGHLATSTYGLMHNAMFEIIGRNVDRAAPLAKAPVVGLGVTAPRAAVMLESANRSLPPRQADVRTG